MSTFLPDSVVHALGQLIPDKLLEVPEVVREHHGPLFSGIASLEKTVYVTWKQLVKMKKCGSIYYGKIL